MASWQDYVNKKYAGKSGGNEKKETYAEHVNGKYSQTGGADSSRAPVRSASDSADWAARVRRMAEMRADMENREERAAKAAQNAVKGSAVNALATGISAAAERLARAEAEEAAARNAVQSARTGVGTSLLNTRNAVEEARKQKERPEGLSVPRTSGNLILGNFKADDYTGPDGIKGRTLEIDDRIAERETERQVQQYREQAKELFEEEGMDAGQWLKTNAGAGFTSIGAEPIRSANAAAEPVKHGILDVLGWLNDKRESMPSWKGAGIIGSQYNLDGVKTSLPDMAPAIEALRDQPALGGVYDYFVNPSDKWAAMAQAENEKGGQWANVGGQVIQNAVRQIPDTMIALMSGGTNVVGRGADVVSQGIGKAVIESAKDMVTSPNFLLSYGQMYGQSYEDRQDAGASPLAAALTSTITTMLNSVVEMGGGIENLPFKQNNVLEWVTSALDEGKEEVIQQVIDSLANKAMINSENPWFSITDENAVINPRILGENWLVGTLAGGLMTGGGMLTNAVTDEINVRRYGRALDKYLAQMAAQNEGTQNEDAVKAPADVSELALQTADNLIAEEKAAAQGGAQDATQQPAQLPRTADQTAETQTAETQTADRPQVVPERTGSQPVRSAAAEALGDEQKQRFMTAAEKYGDKALVFAHNYEGGDVETYDKAFNALYTAGRVGLTLDRVGSVTDALTAGMSETAKRAIWQAGQNSVMTEVRPGAQKMYTVRATNLQKRQIAMLDEIGRKYELEFDIVDSIRVGDRQTANGAYSGGRKIVVALDAAEGAIVQAGVHELTHYLKRTDADAYEVLKNVVMEHLQKSDTFILEDAISARRAQYAGQNLTDEAIIEEIVAEAVPTFLTDEKAVRAFVSENRPLAQKIRDFFVKFAEEIREIAEKYMQRDGAERYEIANLLGRSDALTEIARTFDAALESAETRKDAGAGETVYARKKPIRGADDVSKWTPDSQFMWQHMSAAERDIFRRRISAISQGANAEVAANGDYIVACGHSLVYTDAVLSDPKVFKIITFKIENGTMLDYGMQLVYDLEAEGTNEQELGIVLQSVLGEENVIIRENELRAAIRGKNRSGKGNFSLAAGKGNRGEVSVEEDGPLTPAETRRAESGEPVSGVTIGQGNEVMQEIAEEIADKSREANAESETRFSLSNTSPASSITDENQNLSLPVDVKVNVDSIRGMAKAALNAADARIDERMQARIRGIANKIMKETGSGYSKADFIENVTKLVEEYARSGWTEDTLRAVTEMSKKIIETSSQADNSLREQYADVRKRLRESGVALTETQKQEAANLSGGYGEYRKSVFDTVNLKDEGMTLESLWDELSGQHPEIFTPGAAEGDQVRILQEFAYLMRPKYENPYGMDMDGAALEMAMRIEGDVMAMIGARDAAKSMYGSAEKLRSRFEAEYREKLKQRKAERVQKFQQIAADLKAAKAKGDSAEQAKVMGRYRAAMKATGLDEAYAEIRATLKAREEQKAENAKKAEVLKRIEKQANALMTMLKKPVNGKRVPTKLQDTVLKVLEALDFNGSRSAMRGEETVKAKEYRYNLELLRGYYEDIWNKQSAGEVADVMDGLMMTLSERNVGDIRTAIDTLLGSNETVYLRAMNSRELQFVESLLKTVKHTVDSVGKLWRVQRYQGVAELGDASIEEMSERGPQKISETSAAGKGRDFLALDMLEPVSYGERLGEGGSAIIQGLMDGEKEKFSKVREAAAATMKMMKDAGVSGYDIGKWKTNVQTVEFGNGAKVRMTDAMIMSLYLTAQRPQGRQHLLGNGMRIPTTKETGAQVRHVPLSDNDLQMISDKLTDKQRKMADAMQAYLSTDVAKWGNDVTQRLYLYDAFTEDKYWPLTSDPNVLKTQEPEGDRAFSAILNAGFTKPLNELANNPVIIMDAFDVFGRHIGEMASYAGYAEVMTDTMAWLNYRQRTEDGLIGGTVKESIESLLGSGGVKYLTKLVQDINGARRGGDGTQLNKLLTNYKKAAVMGKIRVWIQQPMSIVRAAAEINPMYLLTGLKAGKGAVAEMQKHSSLAWWKANGNYEIGIGKGTDAILWGDTAITDTVVEKAATLGGLIDPGKADDWAWARIWSAVKREVKRTRRDLTVGSDEYFAEVTRRFEAICDRTQVVDTVMHRSDMMRSKDGLIRSLTSFMSEPTKSYNMLMRSIMEAGRNPKDKAARMKLVRSGWVYVANAAATAAATALFDALKHRDDDDPIWDYYLRGGFLTDWTERLIKNFLSGANPLENIPIVSDAYAVLFKGEEASMMEFQAMKDLYDAFEKGKDYFFGGNEKKLTFYGAVSPAVKVASELTGLPVSGLMANAEMLMHAFDPKLLQTKSDMQTMGEAYDKLYKAMAEGNRKEELAIRTEIARGLYGNDAKNPKEIDTGVAEALAWNDERILKAWQLKQKGQINDLTALYKTIQKDGFTDEVVKKAANRVEGLMNTKYREALEEGETAEAEAIRAKAAKYGMVLTQKEPKDMDEELEAKTIEYKQLFEAIRSGDDEDIAAAAEIMEAESDAVNPAQDVRGQVSGEFRQEYVDMVRSGRTKEAEELGRKLDLFDLDEEDRLKWVRDDYREDLRQAVRDGDHGTAEEIIETMKDEYGLDDESLAQSLTSEFKQEYIDLVMAGKDREADALAEKLQDLGLKYADGNNCFKQANLNKWVRDWEKAQEEDE